LALGPFLSTFTITFNPELVRINLALFKSIANTLGTNTFNAPVLGATAAVVVCDFGRFTLLLETLLLETFKAKALEAHLPLAG
jgi:hypothetical protein